METWPKVKLGDVLRRSDESIALQPTQEYRELTVRLWGKGVVQRGIVTGAEVAASRRFLARAGQFVLSRIDARNGAMGLVPKELDGAIVTNDFPVFTANQERLLPAFLGWLSRTGGFVEMCQKASEGTTNRVRLQENRFLGLGIPLPPLPEQRRVVGRIEEVAGRIEEARRITQQCRGIASALMPAHSRLIFESLALTTSVSLHTVCSTIIDCLHSNPIFSDEGIPTVRSPDVGWGTINLATARKTGVEDYHRRVSRGTPQTGDLIVVREGGGTGKAGIVENGMRFSLGQRVMLIRPDDNKLLPRFLLHQWLSPVVQEDQIAELVKGSASPHLNISSLKKFTLRVPSLAIQERMAAALDAVQNQIDALKALQSDVSAELDALLPSVLDKAFRGEL